MEQRKRSSKACRQCRASKVKCDVAQTGVPCSRCRDRSSGEEGQRCQLLPSRRGGHNRQHSTRERRRDRHLDQQLTPILALEDSSTVTDGNLGDPHDWIGVFENFLRSRGQDAAIEDASITFLGESFPLSHLLEHGGDGGNGRRPRLHHPAPQPTEHSLSPQTPSQLPNADENFLATKGCLSWPSAECLKVLIPTFVRKFYPLYPVVILPEFLQRLEDRTLSLAVLQAACCAACSFCTLAELTPLGFKSHREARDTFYIRAKLLFDFGYEKDKVALLQMTALLSFWPSAPGDVWTFYHRISFGVTLSESLGIHRSMTQVNMPEKVKSLLKRIWSVLQLRDLFGAALFGRPLRINESQCDADHLDLADFEHDYAVFQGEQMPSEIQQVYFIQAIRLSAIVRPIFRLRTQSFSRLGNVESLDSLRSQLQEWHSSLPVGLAWIDHNCSSNTFSKILSIFYNNAMMLTLLPMSSRSGTEAEMESNFPDILTDRSYTEMAQQSAEDILTTASNLTTHNELYSVPHELFTGLFLAQVVLQSKADKDSPHYAKLLNSQSSAFNMVWHQIKEFWEPASWITHLFTSLPKGGDRRPVETHSTQEDLTAFNGDNGNVTLFDWSADSMFTDVQPYLGDLSIFDQGWPTHPVLSSLFET